MRAGRDRKGRGDQRRRPTARRRPGRQMMGTAGVAVVLVVVGAVAAGCSSSPSRSVSASELRSYVAAVDRIRLPVNQLLTEADPILNGFKTKKISPQTASDQMGALETRFAAYTVDINALHRSNARLKKLNDLYARRF